MIMAVDADTQMQQQALLMRLLELTTEQRVALDSGDIAALNVISSLRAQLVQAATAYIPPQHAWDASLTAIASELQQASDKLQQDLRAALEQVREDLQRLNKRERVAEYLPGTESKGRLAWNG